MPFRRTSDGGFVIEGIRWGSEKVVFPNFSINLLKLKDRDCEPVLKKSPQPFEESNVNCQRSSVVSDLRPNDFPEQEKSPDREVKAESVLLKERRKAGRPRKLPTPHKPVKKLQKTRTVSKGQRVVVRDEPSLLIDLPSGDRNNGDVDKNQPVLQEESSGNESCHNLETGELQPVGMGSFKVPDKPVQKLKKLGKGPKTKEEKHETSGLKMPVLDVITSPRILNGNSDSKSPERQNGFTNRNPTGVPKPKVQSKKKSLVDAPLILPEKTGKGSKQLSKKQRVRLPQGGNNVKVKLVSQNSQVRITPAPEPSQNNVVNSLVSNMADLSPIPEESISNTNVEKSPVPKVLLPEPCSQQNKLFEQPILEGIAETPMLNVNNVSKAVSKQPALELSQERKNIKKPINVKGPPPKQKRGERKPTSEIEESLKRKRDDLVVPEVQKLKMPFKIPRRVRTPTPPPAPSPPPSPPPGLSAPTISGGVRVRIFGSGTKGNEPVQNGRPKSPPPRVFGYPPVVSIKESSNLPLKVVVEEVDNLSPHSSPCSEHGSDITDGVSHSPQPARSPSPSSSEPETPQRTTETKVTHGERDDDDMDVLDIMADDYDEFL